MTDAVHIHPGHLRIGGGGKTPSIASRGMLYILYMVRRSLQTTMHGVANDYSPAADAQWEEPNSRTPSHTTFAFIRDMPFANNASRNHASASARVTRCDV